MRVSEIHERNNTSSKSPQVHVNKYKFVFMHHERNMLID